jgi:uncharacterized membrane protein
MTEPAQGESGPSPFPPVQDVSPGAPLAWLMRGALDLRACPASSLFYGAVFAVMGWALLWVFRHAYAYTSALATGFLLLGPFLSIGLYDVSRRRERGEPCALRPTLSAWRPALGAIGVFAIILTVIMLVWARASLVIFALFFTSEMPTLEGFLGQVVRFQNLEFLLVYFGAGALFAALVFAISVVSIPMMMDRGTDAVVAAITSVRALSANPGAMAVWAGLIVLLTAVGFATAYFGLVVTVPLMGHATWHAYRELVGPGPSD